MKYPTPNLLKNVFCKSYYGPCVTNVNNNNKLVINILRQVSEV